MRIPEGTLCHRCTHYFWADAAGNKQVSCGGCGDKELWGPSDFIIDGVEYDVPLVTECTQFKPKTYYLNV